MEIDAIKWKKEFFYPRGQYGLGGGFSLMKLDFEEKEYKELKKEYLDMEKMREKINDVFEFFTCDEEEIKEWFDEENEEDEEDPEDKSEEKKFWETVGLGKEEERKQFERDMVSNFVNCRVFCVLKKIKSDEKNKKKWLRELKNFIYEMNEEYEFDLNEKLVEMM
jgi:hypothetical protein